ncbi:MAG: 3-methyl-2-oxobutanoate hydroxymethyltransferase [Magnetococcales bacterium]|nr:3-methyl-2-oxobutanoate hydroxymethyltransferase [Magnetococcales bacterium]
MSTDKIAPGKGTGGTVSYGSDGHRGRITIPVLHRMKRDERRIVSVTAYDYTFARLLDESGVDLILVGDSLGMVVQGHDTTLPVTLDEMIYHARCVSRGVDRAMVVCDLPFGAFQGGPQQALQSAVRVLKESGAQAVKIEGGRIMAETIEHLVARDIPVVAHVGLTPQSVHAFGGFKVQGRGEAGDKVMEDARIAAESGACLLVLEGMPSELAARITESITIPTIGIGAGAGCDGQVLVLYDLLGLYGEVQPRFVKRYLDGAEGIRQALTDYATEVRSGVFPAPEHQFK